MQLNLSSRLDRAFSVAKTAQYVIERGARLGEALLGVALGMVVALGAGLALRLPDAAMTRLAAAYLETNPSLVDAEGARLMFLLVVFIGLIWAAGAYRRLREWFKPPGTRTR